MLPLPPVAPQIGLTSRVRLGRDYYARVDADDYSVDPQMIGRLVDVTATLDSVAVVCGGQTVAGTSATAKRTWQLGSTLFAIMSRTDAPIWAPLSRTR